MSAITIIDFEDIYTAILELLKIQASDTTTVNRIKRDTNIAYEDVIARHNWWWNRSLTTVQTVARINTPTATLTQGSTSVTFSSAPSGSSLAGYKIIFGAGPEVYTIQTHGAGTANASLNIAFAGASASGASVKIWKDFIQLPSDCKETFIVQHQHYFQPMEACGLSDFRHIVAQDPAREGHPIYYTTDDFDSDGKRRLRFWPANNSQLYNIDIDYLMNFVPLALDGDEPIMPVNDRTVLFYLACSQAWRRERNTEEANNYLQLGEKKLAEMASKMEDSKESPVLRPGVGYMAQKRMQRRRGHRGF
jgi:hypothetical protein